MRRHAYNIRKEHAPSVAEEQVVSQVLQKDDHAPTQILRLNE